MRGYNDVSSENMRLSPSAIAKPKSILGRSWVEVDVRAFECREATGGLGYR